jgi:hypothetical protein
MNDEREASFDHFKPQNHHPPKDTHFLKLNSNSQRSRVFRSQNWQSCSNGGFYIIHVVDVIVVVASIIAVELTVSLLSTWW